MRALVTGASSGIGLALAGELAERGYDLVIAARHDDLLDAADSLRRPGIEVTPVRADLATAAGVDQLAVVDLNVRGTVQLAHHVTAAMVARGEGRILFTSSIAANMPGPFDAVYNASKSFVQSFALALRNELKDTGVTVTSLMPGPSDTALFEKAGMGDTRVGAGPKDDHAEVARMGVEALLAGKERATASSLRTRLEAVVSRLVPDAVKAELHRRMTEPGSAPR